jgi:hypothetical protein
MSFKNNYVSFQGKLYLALRDSNGNPGAFWYVGNAPKIEIAPSVVRREHRESTSGARQIDTSRIKERNGELTINLEDIQKDNLALGLMGKKVTTASGSYADPTFDTFPTGLVNGSIVKLKKPNVSALAIEDSAGTPVALVAGTDYSVISTKHGLVQILSTIGTFTQPLKAEYTYAATEVITGFEADDSNEYFAYCELINTEPAPDQAIGYEIFRISFDPAALLSLINEDQGSIEIKGRLLRDSVRALDAELGAFYRKIYNDANLSSTAPFFA